MVAHVVGIFAPMAHFVLSGADMKLNSYHRQLLWEASSQNVENKNLSPLAISRKIDAVLVKLHQETPTAFVTTVHEDISGEIVFKGILPLLKERIFYNEPISVRRDSYKMFMKKYRNGNA